MSNIQSIEPIEGLHQTYDLEVDHDDHQFYLANGILTSNSHAVAYAIDSYWTAWFLTYYEKEWLCSYLESMSTSPEKKAKAFGEVKSLGYTIVPIDINSASAAWTALPNKQLMPSMLAAKGVGLAAIEEILDNRPYNTIEELLWDDEFKWKHSKFNKKALESLILIEAFNSMDIIGEGKVFSSYRHMYEVLLGSHIETITRKKKGVMVTEDVEVEHSQLIKRSTKADPHEGLKNFYKLLAEYRDIPDWTSIERAQNMIKVFGSLDILSMIDPSILEALEKKGVKPIDELELGETAVVWFMLVPTAVKKGTKPIPGVIKKTKNGKEYAQIFGSGPVGKTCRINVWGCKTIPNAFSLICAETKRDDFGYSTTQWKMRIIL